LKRRASGKELRANHRVGQVKKKMLSFKTKTQKEKKEKGGKEKKRSDAVHRRSEKQRKSKCTVAADKLYKQNRKGGGKEGFARDLTRRGEDRCEVGLGNATNIHLWWRKKKKKRKGGGGGKWQE